MKKLAVTLLLTSLFHPLFSQNVVDTRNSVVEFEAYALWVAQVEGEIKGMKGTVNWTTDLTQNSIDVCIESNTLNSNNQERDAHLKSEDFLETEKYPTICFISNQITEGKDGQFVVKGNLTLHGVTKEISIPFSYKEFILKGSIEIQRKDYNIGSDISTFTASNSIKLEITCVLIP